MSMKRNIDTPIILVNRKNYIDRRQNTGMSIGARIRQARKDLKMSQATLAKLIGIKQPTLSALETGDSEGTAYIATFAVALGVNALWLQTGKGEKNAGAAMSFMELNGLEAQLVMAYRTLSGSRKDALLAEANRLMNEAAPGRATFANPYPKGDDAALARSLIGSVDTKEDKEHVERNKDRGIQKSGHDKSPAGNPRKSRTR